MRKQKRGKIDGAPNGREEPFERKIEEGEKAILQLTSSIKVKESIENART